MAKVYSTDRTSWHWRLARRLETIWKVLQTLEPERVFVQSLMKVGELPVLEGCSKAVLVAELVVPAASLVGDRCRTQDRQAPRSPLEPLCRH